MEEITEIDKEKVEGVVKEKSMRIIREAAIGLPLGDIGMSLETEEFEIEGTNIINQKKRHSGRVIFVLEADGTKIEKVKVKFGPDYQNFIEIEGLSEIIKSFAKVKALWFHCNICSRPIKISVHQVRRGGHYEEHYEWDRSMLPEDGKKLNLDFTKVKEKLKEIAWKERDEIVQEKFGKIEIKTFDDLERFKVSARKITDSIKKPKFNYPETRHFFGEFDICSNCQEGIKEWMTLEEIARLLPALRFQNPRYWYGIKECVIECRIPEE